MLGESVANNETIIVDVWAGYAGVANGGECVDCLTKGQTACAILTRHNAVYILQT